MTTWALIAPGPSATAEQAEKVRHLNVGVISSALPLAPWAQFIAASDGAWWRKYPEAMKVPERYAMAPVSSVTRIKSAFGSPCNSGVLGLEVLKMKGVERVLLIGFDMHGSHYFGPYKNGLSNTPPMQRRKHVTQFQAWAKANPQITVINCSPASALTCFPKARLDECLKPSADAGPAKTSLSCAA